MMITHLNATDIDFVNEGSYVVFYQVSGTEFACHGVYRELAAAISDFGTEPKMVVLKVVEVNITE